MTRVLTASTFALALLTLACPAAEPEEPGAGTGGATTGTGGARTGGSATGGAATGGSATGGSATGGTATGGSSAGGTTGGASTGGAGSSGGSGGSSGDGPVAGDVPAGDASGGGGLDEIGGEPFPGKAWIRLCPKADSQAKCCELLCRCMGVLCADSPMDKSREPNCMSMCMGLSDQRARCQVFHCFESKNPGAVKDHVSHCGHASGRVNGGSCTILGMQK